MTPTIGTDSLMADLLDEKKLAYKVISPRNSKSFAPATTSALQRITYRLNAETRKVRGDHGPFALFETIEQARAFGESGDTILLVEYIQSDEDELWKKNPPSYHRDRSFGRGYRAESNGTTERPLDACPDGTILADSVYVLEIVEVL